MKWFRRCSFLLFFFVSLALSRPVLSRAAHPQGVDIQNPVIQVTPSHKYGCSNKDVLFCERVTVSGRQRLELRSYANSLRVVLALSDVIPERYHSRIQVCFHRNASLGLCQCELDQWKGLNKGGWSSLMSPYEEKCIDVKFIGELLGSVTISVEEEEKPWRLICLCVGFLLLLLAPIVSSWVPFYYSTSMAIGIFLVILILLFQGMKLLPTGKKNFLYISIYSSVVGVGTFLLHHISTFINSVLVNFGLSDDMHNPLCVLLVVGIVLVGAALGCYIVRKFIISEDGTVDVGVVQFAKWGMRLLGSTFIWQSTLDRNLMLAAWVSSCIICHLIDKLLHSVHQSHLRHHPSSRIGGLSTPRQNNRAEFHRKPGNASTGGKMWGSARRSPALSNSPGQGLVSPSFSSRTADHKDHYSTFHKLPKRKKMSKQEWEDLTRETTQQALVEWAGSPEFSNWLMDNADRVQLLPSDCGSDDSMGSESDSTNEDTAGIAKQLGLFSW